jgi:hypothetical protein
MIGLLLSSLSKHNMWSYYDWVVIVVRLRRPHIVLTDGRQRQPNHNTTTYCVYRRKTTTMIGLSLSSLSKHNMWSHYDWVVVTQCLPSVNRICGCIMIGLSLLTSHIVLTDGRQRQPNHNTTTYCVYRRKTTTTQS